MEKSAVEWLGKQLTMLDRKSPMYGDLLNGLIEQAKQMESDNLERLKNFDNWKEWKNKIIELDLNNRIEIEESKKS